HIQLDQSETASAPPRPVNRARLMKFASAVFYAFCSFFIIVVNKSILTEHKFPSFMFLGIGQMTATIIILYVAKMNKAIHFQDFDKSIPGKIFPLPLLYVGNHVTGLGGTQKLSLPMFTVLRKFTILLTMLMESRILRYICSARDYA
uniref:UDP-N-acetylglucosamine/UDP-glucose/GDP-mannose transporter-like n=1 Tax=Sinocyclocheilus grahami TaxID=75366 RepID=A0A672MNQ5_SINGR